MLQLNITDITKLIDKNITFQTLTNKEKRSFILMVCSKNKLNLKAYDYLISYYKCK